MSLPPDLLAAIAATNGGRVVLVLGAGCSLEAPTSLPLAAALSKEAHRKLVEDGILEDGRCPSPSDLSILADTVFAATGSQRALVTRLPLDRFRAARPNGGCLIAAALLLERAVECILTLNFDLSLSHAISELGGGSVSILNGPQQHDQIGSLNVIYLHRNVESDPEEWILRTDSLEIGWRGHWEQCVVARFISAPITVFAGMGSAASVLTESAKAIRQAIPARSLAFVVGPSDPSKSTFMSQLGLPASAHIKLTWADFGAALARRLLSEHHADLTATCAAMSHREHWNAADATNLIEQLIGTGLLHCGKVRSKWLLYDQPYLPWRGINKEHIADLILGIGYLASATNTTAVLHDDGIVEFKQANVVRGVAIVAHGRGEKRWLSMESAIKSARGDWGAGVRATNLAIVSGVIGSTTTSTPSDLTGREDANSIISGPSAFEMITIDELRNSADAIRRVVA